MINIDPSNSKFSNTELASFTKKIGYKLPNDYVKFLKKYNGGYVINSYSSYYKNGEQKFILNNIFGLGLESNTDLASQYKIFKDRIPNTCIPVARDVGGNLVVMNLSDKKYGYILFWDHEEELEVKKGNMTINSLYPIAHSFSDFLKTIELDINETETNDYKVKKVWIDTDFLKELENNTDK